MSEWRLPEAAKSYFERALALGGSESVLRSLIDVAFIGGAAQGSPEGWKGFCRERGHALPASEPECHSGNWPDQQIADHANPTTFASIRHHHGTQPEGESHGGVA